MNNLDEILPLLIILASFIFSFIKKSKKKAEELEKTQLPEGIPQQRKKPVITPKKVNPPPVSEKIVDTNTKTSLKQHAGMFLNQDFTYQEKEVPISLSIEEEKFQEIPFLDIGNQDELKRAIIYAEIFGRKYS